MFSFDFQGRFMRPLSLVAKCLAIKLVARMNAEWINEIPTVPIYYLAKPQPRERTWENQRGKKTLLSLTLVSYCGEAFLV